MNDLPTITIVTPSYNQGEFIEETIRSVLGQNYLNLEYIIMDGGSTDGSVDIIKRYENSLAHWESHLDNGQADAVHRGFEGSTGEIICYLNSDDLLLPGSLERVGRYFLENPQEEWVVGGTVYIGPNNEFFYDRIGIPICNLGSRASLHSLLFGRLNFCQPATFWRRNTYFSVGGFNKSLQFCFDYDLYFRLAKRKKSGQIKEFLACFRHHTKSKTSTIDSVRIAENEIIWMKYGRYQKNRMYRKFYSYWYSKWNYIKFRMLQIILLLRLTHRPPPLNPL